MYQSFKLLGFIVNDFTRRWLQNRIPDANYFLVLGNTTTPRLEIKCQDIFVRKDAGTDPSQVFLVAGLTNVTQDRFFAITGSNGVEGVG